MEDEYCREAEVNGSAGISSADVALTKSQFCSEGMYLDEHARRHITSHLVVRDLAVDA